MKRVLYIFSVLFLSAAQYATAQFEYIFPAGGSFNNFRETHLILRNGALMDAGSLSADLVSVSGSVSGDIQVSIVLSTDGKTVCIEPSQKFLYGEEVTVKVKDGLRTQAGQILSGTEFSFKVRRAMTAEEQQQLHDYFLTHDEAGEPVDPAQQQSTYLPPPADTRLEQFDFVNIYTNNNPSPGELFFHRIQGTTPITSIGKGYGIMESGGDSIFFRSSSTDGENFHINLNGYLTGLHQVDGSDTAIFILDSSYNQIELAYCENGLRPTQHEQLFMPDGSRWFTVYDWQPGWDLSQYGGSSSATVNVSWIQKLDANGNVVFQWRSDQHFAVNEACSDISLATSTVDPWHVNAFYLDDDGKLIASFRNMDRIVKINPSNGSIVWHWGGSGSTYTDVITTGDPDGGFSHQHNVHRIDNGHILMFDNGNLHVPPVSQPKEYALDEVNLTASCVWFYTHPQVNGFNMFTKNQGSAERLANGNTLIGYGLPNIQGLYNGAEIDANKNIVWEFRFKDSTEYTYRLYKELWAPVGIDEVTADGRMNVFPNPSDGMITVGLEFPPSDEVVISVMNLLGQQVYRQSGSYSSIAHSSINLTGLDRGFYILRVVSGMIKLEERILIQ